MSFEPPHQSLLHILNVGREINVKFIVDIGSSHKVRKMFVDVEESA